MIPDFRYWLSKDGQRAVSIIETDTEVKLFTVSVPAAIAAFPTGRVDSAIYNLSLNLMNSQTGS